MSLYSRLVRCASAAVLAWLGSSALAADVPAPPVMVSAAPAIGAPGAGCATCEHGAPAGGCATCQHRVLLKKNKTPYQVHLCPGACFGYFQTQWRKWDDVCPYPYTGHGATDAPRPGAPAINVPLPSELNQPRPLPGTEPKGTPKNEPKGEPKNEPKSDSKIGGTLPPIPPLPAGTKFAP